MKALVLFFGLVVGLAAPVARADAQSDKQFREWTVERMETLAKSRSAKKRAEAADWLGGSRDPEANAALGRALADPEVIVRVAAAGGLWKSEKGAAPAHEALVKALDDPASEVAINAAGAMSFLGMKEKDLAPTRRRVLDAPDASVETRFNAARGLIGIERNIRLLPPMLAYLAQESVPRDTTTIVNAGRNVELVTEDLKELAETNDRALISMLTDELQRARYGQEVILRTLDVFKPKPDGWTALLVGFLDSRDKNLRWRAVNLLGYQRSEKDVLVWAPRVAALTRDPDSSVRNQAVSSLGDAGGLAVNEVDAVVAALGDRDKSVRKYAARAIGDMGDRNSAVSAAAKATVAQKGRPALAQAMEKDVDSDVRDEAKRALAKLGDGSAAAVVASVAPGGRVLDARSEAEGLAYLRSRDIRFESPMFNRALYEIDVPAVRAFLDAGMSASAPLSDMGPPIRIALFSNQKACSPTTRPTRPETKELIKLLLARGADVNGSDAHGNTALSEAASNGCDRETMRLLIKAGARIDRKNVSGLTPFEMGLYSGSDGLEELIAAGYRLPPDKAKTYAQAYAGKPAVQALIQKASKK